MKDPTGHEVNLDSYFNEPDYQCRDGRDCDGCDWCLPARPDANDTIWLESPVEPAEPQTTFFCVCGHDEGIHSILEDEETPNGFVEHWRCRRCGCRDFEVAS